MVGEPVEDEDFFAMVACASQGSGGLLLLLGVAGDLVEDVPDLNLLRQDFEKMSLLSMYASLMWLLVGWHESMGLLDKSLGGKRKLQLGLPLLNQSVLMGPCFTIFRVATEVDGGEGLVVAVAIALPIPLGNLDRVGSLPVSSCLNLALGEAVMFTLS